MNSNDVTVVVVLGSLFGLVIGFLLTVWAIREGMRPLVNMLHRHAKTIAETGADLEKSIRAVEHALQSLDSTVTDAAVAMVDVTPPPRPLSPSRDNPPSRKRST